MSHYLHISHLISTCNLADSRMQPGPRRHMAILLVEYDRVGDKTGDFIVSKLNPYWAVNLQTWGEARVVAEGSNGLSGDCGIESMLVGCPLNRESDAIMLLDEGSIKK